MLFKTFIHQPTHVLPQSKVQCFVVPSQAIIKIDVALVSTEPLELIIGKYE